MAGSTHDQLELSRAAILRGHFLSVNLMHDALFHFAHILLSLSQWLSFAPFLFADYYTSVESSSLFDIPVAFIMGVYIQKKTIRHLRSIHCMSLNENKTVYFIHINLTDLCLPLIWEDTALIFTRITWMIQFMPRIALNL